MTDNRVKHGACKTRLYKVWADRFIQQNNTRKNHLITYKGETKTLAQWIVCLGLTRGALNNRLKHNWSIEEALTKPVKVYKERRK